MIPRFSAFLEYTIGEELKKTYPDCTQFRVGYIGQLVELEEKAHTVNLVEHQKIPTAPISSAPLFLDDATIAIKPKLQPLKHELAKAPQEEITTKNGTQIKIITNNKTNLESVVENFRRPFGPTTALILELSTHYNTQPDFLPQAIRQTLCEKLSSRFGACIYISLAKKNNSCKGYATYKSRDSPTIHTQATYNLQEEKLIIASSRNQQQ